jgi:hypothetical protein
MSQTKPGCFGQVVEFDRHSPKCISCTYKLGCRTLVKGLRAAATTPKAAPAPVPTTAPVPTKPESESKMDDYEWLLKLSGFSLQDLLTSINPMELEPGDVPRYARLLTHVLTQKKVRLEADPAFLYRSSPSNQPAPAPAPTPPAKEESTLREQVEHVLAEEPLQRESASGNDPPKDTHSYKLLALVRQYPGKTTREYVRMANEPSIARHASATLNGLRKRGLLRSHNKAAKGTVNRWFPR